LSLADRDASRVGPPWRPTRKVKVPVFGHHSRHRTRVRLLLLVAVFALVAIWLALVVAGDASIERAARSEGSAARAVVALAWFVHY
jgi:hypothetical protein